MKVQLFTCFTENLLVLIAISSGSLEGVMFIGLDIEIWEHFKDGTKRVVGKRDRWVGEEV
jgi:hypothetical protein